MSSSLGDAIEELRESAGLSQRELAERLDVDPSYLSHLEAGRREPSLKLLRRLSRAVSAPLALFLAEALLPEVPEDERDAYQDVLDALLELSKSRQLDLSLDDGL